MYDKTLNINCSTVFKTYTPITTTEVERLRQNPSFIASVNTHNCFAKIVSVGKKITMNCNNVPAIIVRTLMFFFLYIKKKLRDWKLLCSTCTYFCVISVLRMKTVLQKKTIENDEPKNENTHGSTIVVKKKPTQKLHLCTRNIRLKKKQKTK